MKTFYIAAPWSEREEARKVARGIEVTTGLRCCSGWLSEEYDDKKNMADLPPQYLGNCAVRDLQDIGQADVFIALCDGKDKRHGGRHAEFGIALSMGRKVILVGEPEHIFHYHPVVIKIDRRGKIRQALEDIARGVKLDPKK